jgi:hypothetical protein
MSERSFTVQLTEGNACASSFPHGGTRPPGVKMRLVLLCVADDGTDFKKGQEIEAHAVEDTGSVNHAMVSCGADSSKIYLNYNGAGGGNVVATWNGSSGISINSVSNFALKIYWEN